MTNNSHRIASSHYNTLHTETNKLVSNVSKCEMPYNIYDIHNIHNIHNVHNIHVSVTQNETPLTQITKTNHESTNTQTLNNVPLLFNSKQELSQIIYKYRKEIYSDIEINEDIITHFTDFFILKNQYSEPNKSKSKFTINKRFNTSTNDFVIKTLELLIKNYQVKFIDIASDDHIGEGTYSKVYLSTKNNEVIKIMKSKTIDDEFMFDLQDQKSYDTFWQFIIDMFTYILWTSIFKYAFDMKITETDYTNYLCVIKKPIIIYDRIKPNFCIGYSMKHYEKSLNSLLNEFTKSTIYSDNTDNIHSVNNVNNVNRINVCMLSDVANMLDDWNKLKKYGVTILHRDLSTNNIMIDLNTIKIIDFGFALTSIEFTDDKSDNKINIWKFGEFFSEMYDDIVEPFYDIIFFVLFLIVYHNKLLSRLNIYNKCKRLILVDFNLDIIDLSAVKSLWAYPYKVKYINNDTILKQFMKIFC